MFGEEFQIHLSYWLQHLNNITKCFRLFSDSRDFKPNLSSSFSQHFVISHAGLHLSPENNVRHGSLSMSISNTWTNQQKPFKINVFSDHCHLGPVDLRPIAALLGFHNHVLALLWKRMLEHRQSSHIFLQRTCFWSSAISRFFFFFGVHGAVRWQTKPEYVAARLKFVTTKNKWFSGTAEIFLLTIKLRHFLK